MSAPLLHLFHPAFVHFSVAFLFSGGVLEASGALAGRERMERLGSVLVLLGTLSLVPTLVTGFLAANSIDVAPDATGILSRHEKSGIGILAAFLSIQLWKGWFRGSLPAGHKRAYVAILLAAVGLVVYAAFLGGKMVYVHALGVGTDR